MCILLQLLKNWNDENFICTELKRKDIASKNPLFGSFLAKLTFLLSDEGLSKLTFSKNEIKRCKNLRFWVHKINNLGLDDLSRLFEDHLYLMLFWTHFIAINLFVGAWIVKDSQKFYINKILVAIPLIITYLIGPIGLLFYWIIRIFYAKRMNLYE